MQKNSIFSLFQEILKKSFKLKKIKKDKKLKNYLSKSPEMNFSTFSNASSSVY